MWYTPRTLQDVFERALSFEAGLQLAKGVHLKDPQVMQVSISAICHQNRLEGCIHHVNVRDSQTRSNACWKCGGLGHFQRIERLPYTLKMVTEMT